MSKIGIGVYGFGDDSLQALIKMAPDLTLMCDPPVEFYKAARQALPGLKVIYRHYIADQDAALRAPLKTAQDLADTFMSATDDYPGLYGFQVLNETGADPVSVQRLDRLQERLQDYWFRSWYRSDKYARPVLFFGSWGVGNPQVGAATGWFGDNPLVIKMASTYDPHNLNQVNHIALHEYGPPGQPMDAVGHEWYTTRHNFIIDDLLAVYNAGIAGYPGNGMTKPTRADIAGRMVVLESGTYEPWRPRFTPDEYFRQLAWFQDQIDKDGLLGQCVFGLFGKAYNIGFKGFDLLNVDDSADTRIIDLIAAHNAAK